MSIFDRLTDTAKYTGSHKFRFDEEGRGRGLAGRDRAAKGSGFVRGAPGGMVHDLSQITRTANTPNRGRSRTPMLPNHAANFGPRPSAPSTNTRALPRASLTTSGAPSSSLPKPSTPLPGMRPHGGRPLDTSSPPSLNSTSRPQFATPTSEAPAAPRMPSYPQLSLEPIMDFDAPTPVTLPKAGLPPKTPPPTSLATSSSLTDASAHEPLPPATPRAGPPRTQSFKRPASPSDPSSSAADPSSSDTPTAPVGSNYNGFWNASCPPSHMPPPVELNLGSFTLQMNRPKVPFRQRSIAGASPHPSFNGRNNQRHEGAASNALAAALMSPPPSFNARGATQANAPGAPAPLSSFRERIAADTTPADAPSSTGGGFDAPAATLVPLAPLSSFKERTQRASGDGGAPSSSLPPPSPRRPLRASADGAILATYRPASTQRTLRASADGSSGGSRAAASRGGGGQSVFDKLTDTSLYTGAHKHRFDGLGQGRGAAGRTAQPRDVSAMDLVCRG